MQGPRRDRGCTVAILWIHVAVLLVYRIADSKKPGETVTWFWAAFFYVRKITGFQLLGDVS